MLLTWFAQSIGSRLITTATSSSPLYAGANAVKLFNSWTHPFIGRKLSKAQESIIMVDSYFPSEDAAWFSDFCQKPPRNKTHFLNVMIFMCSPDAAFGAQRVAEHTRSIPDMQAYKRRFDECVDGSKQYLGNLPHIKLEVYEYFTMPQVRLCAIDDEHFFWSDFPVGKVNPWNECEYAKRSRFGAIKKRKIENHSSRINEYIERGRLVWSNRKPQ